VAEIAEGVYVEVTTATIGTGSTAKKQDLQNYYLAKPLEENLIQVQLLDIDYNPLPIFEKVGLDDFKRRFKFLPDFSKDLRSPQEKQIDKAIAQAEAHYRRKEYYSAEFEYNKALKLDEDNVRANFGVGEVYLAQGDKEKALEVFEKLASVEAVFEEKNKHIFNELGIELRRQGLYDQAIAYYTKALSFTQNDENLLFNLARAHYDKGDRTAARKILHRALSLNPDLEEAKQLSQVILKEEKR